MEASKGQILGIGALGLASLAAGAALGVFAERAVVGAAFRHDPDRDEPFGQLRGPSSWVETDDGVRLYVEVEEPNDFRASDPTIVFVHGFSLNHNAWHYQRRDLAGMGRMVFYDQRSHGRSDRAPDGTHTIDQLGHDLAAVIAATAPEGPLILVGHSMGGMTVMSLIAHYPDLIEERVHGSALIATSPGELNTVTLGLPKPAATLMHRYADAAAGIMGGGQPIIDPVRSRANDFTYLMTKIYSFGGWSSQSMTKFVNDMISATPVDVVADYLPALLRHDKVSYLERLDGTPTLVLVGDHDLLTPVQHSEVILRQVPAAEFVVLPSSGHMVILERHADVNMRLRQLAERSMAR